MRRRRLAVGLINLILTVIVGGFLAAALVRYSPGFDVDENAWNPRLSAATASALHARHEEVNSLPRFYLRYLAGVLRGDFGVSEKLGTPVAELLLDRAPVSAPLLLWGTLGGLALGGLMAWLAVWPRQTLLELASVSAGGLLLAIPPAVLALYFFFHNLPVWLGVALALAPRVFGSGRAVLQDFFNSPALLAARARGVGPLRLALAYVAGPAAPRLIAITGVAVLTAFGSLIPIEALCDVRGIGQLTLTAAVSRDLTVLSALALIVTFLVASVQWLGDLAE